MIIRKNIITVAVAATLVCLAVVLAIVIPHAFFNSYKNAAAHSAVDCEQTVNVYDDDYFIKDTLYSQDKVHGIELKNISEINSITYVNHVPNEFIGLYGVKPEIIKFGEFERLDNLSEADRGTLQFVFFNLDPTDENFHSDLETALSSFAYSNNSTADIGLYLPACFDAATVYCNNQYVCTAGDMQDYDPTEYVDKYLAAAWTPNITDVAPLQVDIVFSLSENTISPDRLEAAKIVTVHYKAKNGLDFSSALPRIGKRDKLKKDASSALSAHIVLLTASAAVFVAFIALVALKKSSGMIPAVLALGGAIVLITAELLSFIGSASIGYALSATAVTIISCSPIFMQPPRNIVLRKSRFAAIIPSLIIAAIGCVLPYVASIAATKLFLRIASTLATTIAAALAITGYSTETTAHKPHNAAVLTALCGSAAIVKAWLVISSTIAHPCVYISFFIGIFALWIIGNEFFKTEKREAVLKTNLQKEVEIRTETLKNAISDREKLLSFVSHDMRKSALGISSLIDELKGYEVKDDIVNIANKIENKNDIMLKAMSEILTFAKRNYSDEPFGSVNVKELFEELRSQVNDDCNANGISFAASAKNICCRAQKNALLSVLFNLVFNAIEHADCTQISVTAAAHGDRIEITISDNGAGVDADKDIFSPFTVGDEHSPTNSGLGLFIVKSQTENMGGSISYTTCDGGSAFKLSLLRDI